MNLKLIRTGKGVTQTALSQMAGVDRTLISKIEQGHKTGSVRTLQRIAASLGVSLSCLLGEEGQQPR